MFLLVFILCLLRYLCPCCSLFCHCHFFSVLSFFPHSFLPVTLCGQAILVKSLLEYSQSSESSVWYGLSLAAGLFLMELMRSWSLGLMWGVNYRTAARLRGATLTLAFHKILRLRSTKDISPGEVGVITLEGTPLHIKEIIPRCRAPHADDWDGFNFCSYTSPA